MQLNPMVSCALALALMSGGACGLTACARQAPTDAPLVLLFTGAGTSPNDVRAVQELLAEMRVSYAPVAADDLASMTRAQLLQSRLLIVPGGNFLTMGASLTSPTRATVHEAVQDGLNYLGVCAGAFLAGQATYPSFALTPGVHFAFYAAAQAGLRKTVVAVATPDGSVRDQYWEDGPQLSGWGGVVARYPDGTPAVVEGRSGRGWVVLTGIHPEAPESWRRGLRFNTATDIDHAYARVLIEAALHGTSLPHF